MSDSSSQTPSHKGDGLPPVPRPRGSRTGTPVSRDATPAGIRSRSGSFIVAVPPVPPLEVGGPREGTPVRLVQRDGTPDVMRVRAGSANRSGSRNGSAPRSSSAARAMSASRVNLAKAVFEAQAPSRATRSGSVRHPSRRRQIREEGEGLLRKGSILQKQAQILARMARGDDLFDGAEDDGEDPLEEWDAAIRSLRIDWRNQFSKLFEAGNEAAMDDFRKCIGGSSTPAASNSSLRPVRQDEWKEAEAAWINKVEKRLRTVTVRCLREREDLKLREFLLALEAVLMYFVEMQTAPPSGLLSRHLTDLLVEPLSVETVTKEVATRGARKPKDKGKKGATKARAGGRKRASSVGCGAGLGSREEEGEGKGKEENISESERLLKGEAEGDEEEGKNEGETRAVRCLRVCLRDSSLHRLMLHTLCQFYSLKCKSHSHESLDSSDRAQDRAGERRSSLISMPEAINAKKAPMLYGKVSLAAFLQIECAGE